MATAQQVHEYIAGVKRVAMERGLTEKDINERIDALFSGTGDMSEYIRKKGNKDSPEALQFAYRTFFQSLAKEVATGGVPYMLRFLNWNLKSATEYKDNKPVIATDENGLAMKNPKDGKPIFKKYDKIMGTAIACKVGTTDYKLAQIAAYREKGIDGWEKGNLVPYSKVYRTNMKEKVDEATKELHLTLPDVGVKWEDADMPIVDITENIKREGLPISISDIEIEYQRLKAKSDILTVEDRKKDDPVYHTFVTRGSVLYTSRPSVDKETGKEGKNGKIVLMDEFAIPSIDGVKKSMLTIFCAPGWVNIAGKGSILQVSGTIKYEKEWGNQMYADIIYPVIENGAVVLFKPSDEDIKSPALDESTVRDATATAKSIPQSAPAATSQVSTIPQGQAFNPMMLAAIPTTPPPIPTPPPVLQALPTPPVVSFAQQFPTLVQAPTTPAVKGCDDQDIAFDPAETMCAKTCPRSPRCLANTITHLSKKMSEVEAGSDAQMTIMAKLQKCFAFKKTLVA